MVRSSGSGITTHVAILLVTNSPTQLLSEYTMNQDGHDGQASAQCVVLGFDLFFRDSHFPTVSLLHLSNSNFQHRISAGFDP